MADAICAALQSPAEGATHKAFERLEQRGGAGHAYPAATLPQPPPTPAAPTPPRGAACPNGSYTNVNGQVVCSPYSIPGGPPPGATAICNDGTYNFSQHRQGTLLESRWRQAVPLVL